MPITQLQERHRPLFASLDSVETRFVWLHVARRWPRDTSHVTYPPVDPDELFATCQEAGLDHARVVLSLANLNGAARPTIEKLIGHPILPWAESVEKKLEARGAVSRGATAGLASGASSLPGSSRTAYKTRAKPAKVDSRIVLSVKPQPHKPGTLMHASYECWVVGDTVQACRNRGVIATGVRRDVRRGHVVLGGPK